ncbi:MAG: peptide ABC transporter substrate-binding protein [Spirochaetales bacterium]|nr:peptide ABC transporter substrate-binding protein [Spirochaetales bacterium]
MVNSNPMSDLRVRQAIAYAIDMDTIAESILEGMAVVADSIIPNGSMKKPGLEPYAYDPDKARELLKAANWDSSIDLEMIYYYGDQQTVDLMTAIQAYLADVGIKMHFRQTTDTATELSLKPDDLVNGPAAVHFDLAYGAHAALALQAYYNGYATGMSHTPIVPEVVDLVAAINASPDPEKQKPAFFEIEQYFTDNLPTLPLYYQPMFIFESKRVNRNGGLYGNPQYNYDWGIVNWTVEPDSNGKKILNSNAGPIEKFEDPWANPGIRVYTKVLFDRLLTADGSLVPTRGLMAKDYNLSADGLTLDITLKNGLTWHDGSALTVDDITFSIELALHVPTLDTLIHNTFLSLEGAQDFVDGKASGISGITTSGNSITFKLATVDPNVLLAFTQFAILPEKYLGGIDPLKFGTNAFWQMPIGSGPFKVGEVKMNDYVQMVPFEDYHGGVAKIDQIVCYPTFDSDPNMVKNAGAGRLDYAFGKNTAEVSAILEMDHMRVTTVDVPYTRMIWFQKYPKP